MIRFAINDVIGYFGINNSMVEEALKQAAAGEEIELEINSPGGSCFECIAIFNTIRGYAKSHPVSVVINGIAASAASVIAVAARTVNPRAKVEVSENSIFFIHNPFDYAEGDFHAMQKKADYLQRLAAMFANIYSGVSGQAVKKTQAAMDAETYYIGKEIEDAGFANSLQIINQNNSGDSNARAALIAAAEMSIASARKKLEENKTPDIDNLERAAALLETAIKGETGGFTPENGGGSLPAGYDNQKPGGGVSAGGDGGSMNEEELKQKFPALHGKIFADGKAAGEAAERERVTAHLKLAETAQSYETAAKFIQEGASIVSEKVQAEYLDLAMKNRHTQNRLADNPGDIQTGDDGEDDVKALAAFDQGYSSRKGRQV